MPTIMTQFQHSYPALFNVPQYKCRCPQISPSGYFSHQVLFRVLSQYIIPYENYIWNNSDFFYFFNSPKSHSNSPKTYFLFKSQYCLKHLQNVLWWFCILLKRTYNSPTQKLRGEEETRNINKINFFLFV